MSQKKVALSPWWGLLPILLSFAFFFPRVLANTLGAENPWTSYFYLYGFGAIYSGLGLLLILKTGACRLDRPRDRFWFQMLIAGFVYFLTLHGVWIYLALSIPYLGGQ